MTPNEWIVKFMTIKNKIIAQDMKKPMVLTTEYDLEEIMQWGTSIAKGVKNHIKEYLKYSTTTDSHICPWCIINIVFEMGDCESCRYAKRNGKCNYIYGRYIKVCDSMEYHTIIGMIRYEWNEGTMFDSLKEA